MKTLSILTLLTALTLFSCQKSSIKPTQNSENSSSTDDATTRKSNMTLLTQHTWEYAKYWTNYIDSAHPGTVVYRRGSTHNSLNLDLNRVTYHTDGTEEEIDQYGNLVPGTWYFTNPEQTSYEVSNSYGNFYTNIEYLTNRKFEWTEPNEHTHAIMIVAY